MASDLGLHGLPMSLLLDAWLKWVNDKYKSHDVQTERANDDLSSYVHNEGLDYPRSLIRDSLLAWIKACIL